MNSELFSNFIITSEVGIATTTPVKKAEIILIPLILYEHQLNLQNLQIVDYPDNRLNHQ